ncbi:S53 family peptidase [Dictyobacter kobayashii]|uniref:Peptidase S53 domain-containing protein n=1 Tax=Dictyobacter kobayashii TaxID=2014872 RepID=A0A402AB54_9CHLR|nr:S53 family peptidase [Dictyobacter kobayashii]GCE16266.1 hypothetical protein KDK_00660 [Dictyobacter kobayashii]
MIHLRLSLGFVLFNFLFALILLFPETQSVSASTYPASIDLKTLATHAATHDIPLNQDAVHVYQKQLACLTNISSPRCYTPQQIRHAYHIQPLLNRGVTGRGQTIAIIDFFQSPTIRNDLHVFDQLFGLPDPHLTIFTPLGLTPFVRKNTSQLIAAEEINLDVEWAHAIAPEAAINLILSKSEGYNDLYATTRFVIQHNLGDVISQSFGFPETAVSSSFLQKEHALFELARAKGISVFASAGDRGTLEPVYSGEGKKIIALGPGVEYPASDPLVTGVGGTSLSLLPSDMYQQEVVWSNTHGSTGGGFSRRFLRPSYQDGFVGASRTRGVPDVAYVGDPNTGVPIVFSNAVGQPMLILWEAQVPEHPNGPRWEH